MHHVHVGVHLTNPVASKQVFRVHHSICRRTTDGQWEGIVGSPISMRDNVDRSEWFVYSVYVLEIQSSNCCSCAARKCILGFRTSGTPDSLPNWRIVGLILTCFFQISALNLVSIRVNHFLGINMGELRIMKYVKKLRGSYHFNYRMFTLTTTKSGNLHRLMHFILNFCSRGRRFRSKYFCGTGRKLYYTLAWLYASFALFLFCWFSLHVCISLLVYFSPNCSHFFLFLIW